MRVSWPTPAVAAKEVVGFQEDRRLLPPADSDDLIDPARWHAAHLAPTPDGGLRPSCPARHFVLAAEAIDNILNRIMHTHPANPPTVRVNLSYYGLGVNRKIR